MGYGRQLPGVSKCCRKMPSTFYALLLTEFLLDFIAAGIHIEPSSQVDLIDSLRLDNATYQGVYLVRGMHHFTPAIRLSGDSRKVQLSQEVFQRTARLLSQSTEFTMLASLRQELRNAGAILAFSEGSNRFLELQSSGRKDEIRFHYSHDNTVLVETFPYRLADNTWHQIAVTVSGNSVTVFVDCNRIYSRVIQDIDLDFRGRNLSLWLGQRNLKHFYFKGVLQDVKILFKPHGFLLQCPHLDTECPTCGQFKELQQSVNHLKTYIENLTQRLAIAEERIAAVEECECQKSCRVNGTFRPDGSMWKKDCDICSCVQGKVECRPITCSPPPCKHPVLQPGECCPTCLMGCMLKQVTYDHGEQVSQKCVQCTCNDGEMQCRRIDQQECPPLNCPASESFSVPGECCKFCPGVDYCSQGHDCHENATCSNLKTKYTCQCKMGYTGNGRTCKDVDECQEEGGLNGHHCRENTVCKNVPGSYVCECLPGFRRVDAFNCEENDECASNEHNCHENAKCINTIGSYKCVCEDGYEGDGFSCQSVCNQTCLNGGKCIAPNVCSCRRGYKGNSCEIDIDECKEKLHHCHINSECVNMPGWYYCECHPGYQSNTDDDFGASCEDTDECALGTHTCHSTATCINLEGSFQCKCLDNDTCSLNCDYNGKERLNGEVWSADQSSCTVCSCNDGVAECKHEECNCNNPNVNLECCPQCDKSSYCVHQEAPLVMLSNGERWIYQCQICECLFGEVDCWSMECPHVSCDNPIQNPGDCCPYCEDDPCYYVGENDTSSSNGKGCTYLGRLYQTGEQVPLAQDPCTTCKCKNGQLCCKYATNCNSNSSLPSLVHNRLGRSLSRGSNHGRIGKASSYFRNQTTYTKALKVMSQAGRRRPSQNSSDEHLHLAPPNSAKIRRKDSLGETP